MSENCRSLVLQDKCHIEIFLSPELYKNCVNYGQFINHLKLLFFLLCFVVVCDGPVKKLSE